MCSAYEPGNMIDRDDCLLVIIDAQEKLIPAVSGGEEVMANIVRLVRFSEIVGIPVLVTEQEKLGSTVAQVRECLSSFDPVKKVHFDCFSCHDFKDRVLASGRRSLLLTGAEAHICVAQTALGAGSSYRIHVAADAISSRTAENKEIALLRMTQAGSTITSTEMFIYEVLRRAGTEEFRAVLPLVK